MPANYNLIKTEQELTAEIMGREFIIKEYTECMLTVKLSYEIIK